jgi:hypothetical protein
VSICSDIEAALLDLLRAGNNLASVKTFEADIRECLFSGDKLIQGFRPEELPAVNVTAQLKPASSEPFSSGEAKHTVPVTIVVITKATRKKDARSAALQYQESIVTVLDAARRSDGRIGRNTLVTGELESSSVVIEEKPFHFAIATVEGTVLKVVEI